MKHLGKLTILGAVLAASATLASATPIPIQLGSFASTPLGSDSNSAMQWTGVDYTTGMPTGLGTITAVGPSATAMLNPGTVWYGPLANSTWVGIATSAQPGGSANPAYGYYVFDTTFSANAGTYNGMLNVLADDTVEVLLNGTAIVPFGAIGSDSHCSQNPTGCLLSTETKLSLSNITLNASNTLEFIVEQAGNPSGSAGSDPSGIDFNASLTETPEPSSLFLLGTGLLGAAGIARRRLAAKFI